jgi:hypothetical protein
VSQEILSRRCTPWEPSSIETRSSHVFAQAEMMPEFMIHMTAEHCCHLSKGMTKCAASFCGDQGRIVTKRVKAAS